MQKTIRSKIHDIGYDCSSKGFDANSCGVVVALDGSIEEEIKTDYQLGTRRMIVLGIPDDYAKRRNNLDVLDKILNKKLEPLAQEISLSRRKRPSKETL